MARTTHCAYQQKKNRKILERLQNIKRFTTKTPSKVMEKLAGSLHHALFGIPGGAGMFPPIQVELKGTRQWLRVTPDLTQCLQDWGDIIKYMGRYTTQVRQLVNSLPQYIGYSYSCGIGTGGVWTSGLNKIGPIMWKEEWPQKINDLLNEGTLTIKDLKLTGLVLNWLALECLTSKLSNTHAALFCDNNLAVGWAFKLISGSSLASIRLLRFLGMHIHATQASHLTPIIIAGKENDMADVVSRDFQKGKFFAAKKNLTAYFETHFTPPQGHSWTEFTLPTKWTQQVMSCMIGKRLTMGSLLRLPGIRKNTGRHVNAMPPHGTSTPSSKAVTSLTSSLSSHIFLHGSGKVNTERAFKSRFQQLLRRYRPSPRLSTWLENPVPSKRRKKTTSSLSNA